MESQRLSRELWGLLDHKERGKRNRAPIPLGLKEPQIHIHFMDKQRDAGNPFVLAVVYRCCRWQPHPLGTSLRWEDSGLGKATVPHAVHGLNTLAVVENLSTPSWLIRRVSTFQELPQGQRRSGHMSPSQSRPEPHEGRSQGRGCSLPKPFYYCLLLCPSSLPESQKWLRGATKVTQREVLSSSQENMCTANYKVHFLAAVLF